MKLSSRIPGLCSGATILLVAVLLPPSLAQVDGGRYQKQSGEASGVKEKGRVIPSATKKPTPVPWGSEFQATSTSMYPQRVPALAPEFAEAIEALRAAEGGEAKSEAEDNLRDVLTEYFGEDMKRREAELKEMEKRLKKLQEQLALRSEKMDEIVELQMKVLVNQANGLGFFSGEQPPKELRGDAYFFYSPRNAEQRSATILPAPQPVPSAPIAPPAAGYEAPAERDSR